MQWTVYGVSFIIDWDAYTRVTLPFSSSSFLPDVKLRCVGGTTAVAAQGEWLHLKGTKKKG